MADQEHPSHYASPSSILPHIHYHLITQMLTVIIFTKDSSLLRFTLATGRTKKIQQYFRQLRARIAKLVQQLIRAGWSGDQIPVGVTFSAPIQTRPETDPASCYNGYQVSFQGVKRPGRDINHPPPPSTKVEESVQLCLYSPSEPLWPVLG